MNKPDEQHFTRNRAAAYDERQKKVAPMMQSMYRCTDAVLAKAPGNARVLCVGAGTGTEILALAEVYPGWTFTAVEPQADMLNIFTEKAKIAGILDRCTLHEGYLDTLPKTEHFDVATSIQVSYFMLNLDERTAFYADIASRLNDEGFLVNAEFAGDLASPEFAVLRDAWVALHHRVGLNISPDYLGRDVAVMSVKDTEKMLFDAGFSEPVLYYQNLIMHAWCSRKKFSVNLI